MTNAEKIGWLFGFNAGANWEITPMNERKYDDSGNCTNESRIVAPNHKDYQSPIKAFEKKFGEKFQLS